MEITVEELNKLLDEQWKRGFEAGKVHTAKETFVENGKLIASGKLNGHAFVDLGLPSGTLWATCNVGANSPEAFGDYFAWGETKPKKTYTEYNYSYFSDTPVLPASADAATVNWGEGWRMPTEAEFEELKTKCKWTWMENGYKVEGLNGNSIFLPTTGSYIESEIHDTETLGYYWSSSSPNVRVARAFIISLEEEMKEQLTLRSWGGSIRPVVCVPQE